MSYIINISDTNTTTINLVQGRVELKPKEWRALCPEDVDRARKLYNKKELNLCIVNSQREIELIVGASEKPITEETENIITNDESTQTSTDSESTETQDGETTESTGSAETSVDTENSSQETETTESEDEDEDLDPEAKAIKDLRERIAQYRSEGNLNALKELATKLSVNFMPNIGTDKLAERILLQIG